MHISKDVSPTCQLTDPGKRLSSFGGPGAPEPRVHMRGWSERKPRSRGVSMMKPEVGSMVGGLAQLSQQQEMSGGGAWKRLSAPGHHHKSAATIAFQISNRNRCLDGNVKSCRLSEDLNCG